MRVLACFSCVSCWPTLFVDDRTNLQRMMSSSLGATVFVSAALLASFRWYFADRSADLVGWTWCNPCSVAVWPSRNDVPAAVIRAMKDIARDLSVEGWRWTSAAGLVGWRGAFRYMHM